MPAVMSRHFAPLAFDPVLRAILSLYEDQVKPEARILKKRLEEHGIRSTVQELFAVIRAYPEFFWLEGDTEGKWVAGLCELKGNFVDVASKEDDLLKDEELWWRLDCFVKVCRSLPGGRYECARELQQQHFIRDRSLSLGKLCHIVQLALDVQNIFGFNVKGNAIVPFEGSKSASKQQRCSANKLPERKLAKAWGLLRRNMQRILLKYGTVSLSEVKNSGLFAGLSGEEPFDETTMGFPMLMSLLKDEHMQNLCKVEHLDGKLTVITACIDLHAPVPTSPVTLLSVSVLWSLQVKAEDEPQFTPRTVRSASSPCQAQDRSPSLPWTPSTAAPPSTPGSSRVSTWSSATSSAMAVRLSPSWP